MAKDLDHAQSEAQLLAAAHAGDRRAASDLTSRLAPRLFGGAFAMLGNRAEAEDVVQEAMLRLWRIAPDWSVERGAKPSSWAYGVMRNLCLDRMRRARGVALDSAPEPLDPSPSAEARLQTQTRQDALHAALRLLPERQRQAVVLRHIEGLSNPEIAEILSISVEAVESLTSRARAGLKATLAGRQKELGFEDDET